MRSIAQKIKLVSFKCFEGYDSSSLLQLASELEEIGVVTQSWYKQMLSLILALFFKKSVLRIRFQKDASILSVFAHETKRKDLYDLFFSVSNLIEKRDVIVLEPASDLYNRMDFVKGILCTPYVVWWLYQMTRLDLTGIQKVVVIKELVRIWKFKYAVSDFLTPQKYNLLLVFFDADSVYNYLTQKFQLQGVKVATLQHGIVLSERPNINNIDFKGIEFSNSASDYFLAWNDFSRKEGLKAGLPEAKIQVLGVPKCIPFDGLLSKKREESINKEKVFGVVLDGRFTEVVNYRLIEIANQFAVKHSMQYSLKFHPAFKGNEYDSLINPAFLKKKFVGGGDILKYSNEVIFSLVANSTVLIELLFIEHPVFCFYDGSDLDKYRDLIFERFIDMDSLDCLYVNQMFANEDLYESLVTIMKVRDSYSRFFKRFSE